MVAQYSVVGRKTTVMPDFTLFNRRIDISLLFIQVPGVLFIVYEIRKIMEIRKNIGRYKELIPSHE